MDYTDEDREDKKYKGKGYGRKEFKKDVAEAVKPVVDEAKKKEGKKKAPKKAGGYGKKQYQGMKASELRTLLNNKKKSLLTKSGFPDGKIPRGKDAMINLCVKLKRKRW